MKAIIFTGLFLITMVLFGYNPKESKAPKGHRVTNNSRKSTAQLCADRGHIFDEDSTVYVPKNEAKTKSYIADYEDSTVQITPMPYNIQRVCLRCGKKIIEQTADKREVIWRRPIIVIDQPIIINGVEYD
jgi:hypothetical protein